MPPPEIIGRYEIIGPIGSGGMGSLWRARDPKIGGRTLAIKILKEGIDNEEVRRRFMQEANAAGVLEHENIVRIFDVGEHHGEPFIAMEFIDGETLSAWIRRREPATLARRLKLIEELCDGLAYAHTFGIVHRDVKPANLMVERRRGRLKILDFGIAKLADSGITNAGALIGSFNYMSPEQVRGLAIDHRSDIFSVGAVLFELVSYRQAFPGGLGEGVLGRIAEQPAPLLSQAMAEADPDIERVIARALEKDPGLRYPDLVELHRDLARVRKRMERGDSDELAPVERQTPPRSEHTPPPQTPRPTPRSGRAEEEAQRVARKRAQQLEEYLAAAERALANGDYEAAIEESYHASALHEEEPRARDVRERAQAAMDLLQVRQWLGEARAALSRHDVDAAEALVTRARELRPDVTEIRDVQQSVIRVRNHAAALAALDRARRNLGQREWTSAIRESAEADRFEPGLDEARSIRRQAQAALEEQRRAEAHEQAARHAIVEAKVAFARQDIGAAIAGLAAFAPPHPAVTRELDRLRAEAAAIEERAAREREREQRVGAAMEAARRAVAGSAWDEAGAAADAAQRDGADPQAISRLRAEIAQARSHAEALARTRAEAAAIAGDAQQRFDAGDYKGAIARCEAALHLVADDPAMVTLRERAQRALEAEEERARREAHDAAASQQLDSAGREFAAGRHQEAIARLERFQPPHPRVTAAIDELRSALAAIESRATDAVSRARQAFRAGQHEAAIQALATFEPPGLPAVTEALTALQSDKRRLDEAAREAKRLEEQRRAEAEARRQRDARVAALIDSARQMASATRFDEAQAALDEAFRIDRARPELADVRRDVQAARAAHEAAERRARDLAAKVADGVARLAKGDAVKAFRRAEEVLAADAQHEGALALRAQALELEQRQQQEAEAARTAARLEREARERASQVASLLKRARKARKPEAAVEVLQQVLAIEPGQAEAQALLRQHQDEIARAARDQQARTADLAAVATREIRPLTGAREAAQAAPIPVAQVRPPIPAGVFAAAALGVVLLGGGLFWYVTQPDPVVDDATVKPPTVVQPSEPTGEPEPPPAPPPPALGMASVTIDTSPWTRVTITPRPAPGASGSDERRKPVECTTPCSLKLAEGSYSLSFENKALARPLVEAVTVQPGRPLRVRRVMPGFDADQAVNNIFGASP